MALRSAFLSSVLRMGAIVGVALAPATSAQATEAVADIFEQAETNQLAMEVEIAIARAQADLGIIPEAAAAEIARTGNLETVTVEAWSAENEIVRHRLVALLNVWRRSLSPEASNALHFGPTTVDIYDAVMILQLRRTIASLHESMIANERRMLALALEFRDTPMVGRTLGQHALPITFGKKVAVWADANRRNIERLETIYCKLGRLGVVKGAVGTHLGLGERAAEVESRAAAYLGFGELYPADWHGMRDVFGEYATTLAIMARVNAGIGQEIFLMQMTDIGEVYEERPGSAVSSSTLPHKRNPSRSEGLMHLGRTIPAQSLVLLDDIANVFERDNTSRPNDALAQISVDAASSVADLGTLLRRLEVDPERMRENLQKTDGMILAQRITFALTDALGKEAAEDHVADAAKRSLVSGRSFREELLADPVLAPHLRGSIDALLDYTTYLGDAAGQVDRTIAALESQPPQLVCVTAKR